MRIALWLQVFLISSPIIAWKLSSGFCFNLTLIGDQFGFDFWLGSGFQFNLFTKLPWGIGINLFPILMLILIRYLPIPQKTTAPPIPGQVSSIFQANILTTPPADQGTQLRTSAQGEAYPMIVSDPPTTEDEVPDEEAILPRQTIAGGDERRQ